MFSPSCLWPLHMLEIEKDDLPEFSPVDRNILKWKMKNQLKRGFENEALFYLRFNLRPVCRRFCCFRSPKRSPKITIGLFTNQKVWVCTGFGWCANSTYLCHTKQRYTPAWYFKGYVRIIPEKKYPFKLVEQKEGHGKNISYTIERVVAETGEEYLLTVKNLKQVKGLYFETITMKTDTMIQPEIKIRIYGNISEPK